MDELAVSGPAVGQRFGSVHRFRPEDVIAFSLAAGDLNPLHHDAELAAASRYGGLIVSGTHTTALLLGLTATHFARHGAVVGVAFSVDFERAVRADAQVTLEWTVIDVRRARRDRQRYVDMTGTLRDALGQICVRARGTVLVGPDLEASVDQTH